MSGAGPRRWWRCLTRAVPAAAVGVSIVGLTGCAGDQSALDPVGPFARSIAVHWWVMFGIGTAVLLVVCALFIHAIHGAPLRRPVEEPPAESGDDDDTAERKTRVIAAGVGITVVILLVVMVHAILVSRDSIAIRGHDGLEIEVTGYQWWWEVRYLSERPDEIVVTANEIHIPAGEPVLVRLKSADVIHSFWVPNLQGKMDMIPGRENQLKIQADVPGMWRGQCAEFCGLQHARMAMVLVAHERAEFDAWRQAQLQPALPAVDPLAVEGERVFLAAQCAYCHRIRGTRAGGTTGPDLTHFASRHSIAAATLPNTRGHLAGWLLDPQQVKPGTRMPPTPLQSAELHALLHYLETLR